MSRLSALAVLVSLAASPAFAETTARVRIVHYGRLLNSDDTLVEGSQSFTARLYTDRVPGSETDSKLWEDTFSGVPVNKGMFSLDLGSGAALDASVFAGRSAVYLTIAVNNGSEFLPRLTVGRVGNAAHAETADAVRWSGGTVALNAAGKWPASSLDIPTNLATTTNGKLDAALLPVNVPLLDSNSKLPGSVLPSNVPLLDANNKLPLSALPSGPSGLDSASVGGHTPSDAANGDRKLPVLGSDGRLADAVLPTSAVLSSGTYADPAWLTSLAGSKVSGTVPSAQAFTGTLGGDVTGAQGATVVGKLQGAAVSNTPPSGRQVLTWNGSAWAPAAHTAVTSLTDAGTITVNAALGNVFDVTVAGNRTISNPSNLQNGETYVFRIRQDSTGGRNVVWGTSFVFGGSGAATIAQTANALSIVAFVSDGSNLYSIGNFNTGSSTQPITSATGGNIATINGFKIHTFNSVGSSTFTPTTSGTVEVLVVAGGGSGGAHNTTNGNGGGGAGGVVYHPAFPVVANTNYTVTVGAGAAGVGGNSIGSDGGPSVFGTLVANGGGGGGGSGAGPGRSGGSGGGGARDNGAGTYGNQYAPQYGLSTQVQTVEAGAKAASGSGAYMYGNRGGAGDRAWTGGGGGGAGGVGQNGFAESERCCGGNGGLGIASSISGSLQYYAGGGGGGSNSSERGGDGFDGGGRGWGTTSYYNYNSYPTGTNPMTRGSSTQNALPNTGGGGGGGSYWAPNAGYSTTSGAGGSGIVIVRYPIPN